MDFKMMFTITNCPVRVISWPSFVDYRISY